MFYYARSDTHYLLYIYDMIRNELLEKSDRNNPEQDLIMQVLDRSRETSLRRHEKIVYDAEEGQGPFGWYNLLLRHSSGTFTKEQFAVFRAVHKWRDEIARREDEDPLFIMPNAILFDIVRRLPPDPKALHGTFGHNTSYVAKREVTSLFRVIAKARTEGINGPSVVEVLRGTSTASLAIGAVAQSVFPQLKSSENENILGTKELVSTKSRLWGKVVLSSRWEEGSTSLNKPAQSLQFSLPWAHMLEGAGIDTEQLPDIAEASKAEAIGKPDPASQDAPDGLEVDSQFTLKAGLKRKAPESESESEGEEDEDEEPSKTNATPGASSAAAGETAEADPAAEKAARKKARKEEKKARQKAKAEVKRERREAKAAQKAARKAARQAEKGVQGSDSDESGEEDDQPFDYAQAGSVLNAKRGTNGGTAANDAKGANTRFNPYANAMMADGPKPARRMHGEKAGKSATFKR